jgi:hypothetical protein
MNIKVFFDFVLRMMIAVLVGVAIWSEGMCLSAYVWQDRLVDMNYIGDTYIDTSVFGDSRWLLIKSEDELKSYGVNSDDVSIDFSKNYVILTAEYQLYGILQLREEGFPFRYTNEIMLDYNFKSINRFSHIYTVPRVDFTEYTQSE